MDFSVKKRKGNKVFSTILGELFVHIKMEKFTHCNTAILYKNSEQKFNNEYVKMHFTIYMMPGWKLLTSKQADTWKIEAYVHTHIRMYFIMLDKMHH